MVCLRCLYQRTLVLNRQFVTNIYLPNRADKQIEKPFWALPYLKQFHLIQFLPIKRFDSSTYEDQLLRVSVTNGCHLLHDKYSAVCTVLKYFLPITAERLYDGGLLLAGGGGPRA